MYVQQKEIPEFLAAEMAYEVVQKTVPHLRIIQIARMPRIWNYLGKARGGNLNQILLGRGSNSDIFFSENDQSWHLNRVIIFGLNFVSVHRSHRNESAK